MVARFAGTSLGLLAFTITIAAGLLARNPVGVTLSRSILALFVFCLIGLILGTAARLVVAEYERNRKAELRKRYHEDSVDADNAGGAKDAPNEGVGEGESVGA